MFDGPSNVDAKAPGGASVTANLSAREVQVLQGVSAAQSNKRIASNLNLSVHTVKRHVARIMTKLRVHSRAEAAALYRGVQPAAAPVCPAPCEDFTAREIEVIAHFVRGQSNLQIAAELSLSVNTIKRHTATILDKFGVSSRIEAAALAQPQLSMTVNSKFWPIAAGRASS